MRKRPRKSVYERDLINFLWRNVKLLTELIANLSGKTFIYIRHLVITGFDSSTVQSRSGRLSQNTLFGLQRLLGFQILIS